MDENNTNKIRVRFFSSSLKPVDICQPTDNLTHVEQLVHKILDDHQVGPVYRSLFGLRHLRRSVWLSPNHKVQDLLKRTRKRPNETPFELRLRFRPTFLSRLNDRDTNAFNIIFAQIRYDFIHTKFNDEKKDFVLPNDAVLGLIAIDLTRYALENDLTVDQLFERVRPNDFVPHKASRIQRRLLFRLREKLNIRKSVEAALQNSGSRDKVHRIKLGFVELFLKEVCKDYCTEIYQAQCLDDPREPPRDVEIRLRYEQDDQDDTICVIESRSLDGKRSKERDKWTEICDIYSINHGILRQKTVEINTSNARPFRAIFESNIHARSFLSLVDGYYRLMRKWHFNFCRDVLSPELEYLRSIRCHGPIGSETSKLILRETKRPGTFLVRRCMNHSDRYVIEVLCSSDIRIIINLDYDPVKKVYRKLDHMASKQVNFTVRIGHEQEFYSLKELVNEIQIFQDGDTMYQDLPLQLKFWLPPSEHGDYPTLLLSISKTRFKELIDRLENKDLQAICELPKFIPDAMLQSRNLILKSSGNFEVALASLKGGQDVIIKSFKNSSTPEFNGRNITINVGVDKLFLTKIVQSLDRRQYRILDWIFVKGPHFADTLGLQFSSYALIQEYLPLGSLDKFLHRERDISEILRKSIACQLASALLFLQDKRIIHGKIRCHNVFIKSFHPFQVKVTDPLGTIDIEEDQAFLPPEYLGIQGDLTINEYSSAIDVWALGTTLWQVYSKGQRPPTGIYANTLIQPSECPNQIWSTIETCWSIDATVKASPQAIHRDLNDAFAWDEEAHRYEYITQEFSDTHPNLDNRSYASSSNYDGSEAHLIVQRNSNNPNGSNHRPVNQVELTEVPTEESGPQKKSVAWGWNSVVLFKNNLKTIGQKLPSFDYLHGDFYGSSTSLSSWSSQSASEVTELTDYPEFTSSDGVIDRYVWQVNSNRLKLGAEIGRGSSGVVMKGVLSQEDGSGEQVVAVKCLNNKEPGDYSSLDDLRREFDILRKLDHKNIVKTLGFVDEAYIMLIVEYMPLGSLLNRLKYSKSEHLTNLPLQKYALDIATGMEYLESMKIIHRDLALRNILVKSQDEVKICDFGLAQYLGTENHYKLKTDRALPLKWYAPETLSQWTFTHKSDVWSFGIVLWEIYSGGSSPQYSGNYATLFETLKHERLLRPFGCPDHMYDLMHSCWAYQPENRCTFSEICELLMDLSTQTPKPEQTSDSTIKSNRKLISNQHNHEVNSTANS